MIAVFLPYRRCEQTLAGLAVADCLTAMGHQTQLVRAGDKANVDDYYDRRVQLGSRLDQKTVAVLRRTSHVIWCGITDELELEVTKRLGPLRNLTYVAGEDLTPYEVYMLGLFDTVMVPSHYVANTLRRKLGLRHVVVLPYWSNLPVSRRARNYDLAVKLLLPLWGDAVLRTEFQILQPLAKLLKDYRHVQLTLLFASPRHEPAPIRRVLRRMQHAFKRQCQIRYAKRWSGVVRALGEHDLTIWPALWSAYSVVPVTSLRMGTPVVAWNCPVTDEVVLDRQNGRLVTTRDMEQDEVGILRACTDTLELELVLRELLDSPGDLRNLNCRAGNNLQLLNQRTQRALGALINGSV